MVIFRGLLVTLLALFVTCIGCGPGAMAPAAPPPVTRSQLSAAHAIEATVALVTPQHNLVCAAQYISPTRILTAAHCIPDAVGCIDAKDIACQLGARIDFVTFADWRLATVRYSAGDVVAVDHKVDLALIVARKPYAAFVGFGAVPDVGDLVYSVGHPNGDVWTAVPGFVIDPVYSPIRERVSIRIWFGSSGGGLYNLDGQLIGVTSQMDTSDPDQPAVVGYYVPVPVIRRFLAAAARPASP